MKQISFVLLWLAAFVCLLAAQHIENGGMSIDIAAEPNGVTTITVRPLVPPPPPPPPLGANVWNSWDVVTQSGAPQGQVTATATGTTGIVEFYESINNGGVFKGALLGGFTVGTHPDAFNNVERYWGPGTGAVYPYVGKSTVNRGSDAGETNVQMPLGVRDLQMVPPSNSHYVVAAFRVPSDGTYTISNVGVRRVSNLGDPAALHVFNAQQVEIAMLTATNNRAWVTSPTMYALSRLTAGDYLYFAVDRVGDYAYDATEITWTVTETDPPTPNVTGSLLFFGDSTGDSILSRIVTSRGIVGESHSVSGAQAADLAGAVYATTPTSSARVTIYATGINDERVYGTDAARLQSMAESHLAQLAWLALPEAHKVRIRTGSGVTFTGSSWGNTPVYGLGKYATTVGDTVTATVSGRVVYIGIIQQDAQTGHADLFLDGNPVATLTTAPPMGALIATPLGASYTARLIRMADIAPGSHVVQVVQGGNGAFYVDWVGGTDGLLSGGRPVVLVGNCIPGAFGYPYGGSDQAVNAVNALIAANVQQLQADGLDVRLVDVFSAVTTPAQDIQSDGIHPTGQGYAKIAAAYLAAMTNLQW